MRVGMRPVREVAGLEVRTERERPSAIAVVGGVSEVRDEVETGARFGRLEEERWVRVVHSE